MGNVMGNITLNKPKYSPFSKEFYMYYRNMNEEDAINEAKSKRPCNIEFWMRKGFSKSDSIIKVCEHQKRAGRIFSDKLKINKYLRITPSQLEYWLNKGFSEKEAKKKQSERQTTFSKKILIQKYGEIEGTKLWKKRQDKWQSTLKAKSQGEIEIINRKKAVTLERMCKLYGNDIGTKKYNKWYKSTKENIDFASKEATCIFLKVINILKDCIDYNELYFNNIDKEEYSIYDLKNDRIYFYDFCILNKKIIIEYHGIKFHPSKKIKKEDRKNWKQLFSNKSYNDVRKRDRCKKKLAKNNGFKFFDIYSDDNNIVNKIVKFIRSNL